jgi:hypothetical protein
MHMSKKKNKRRNSGCGRKNKTASMPSNVELFLGAPSQLIVAAFQRSGAGFHADKRFSKKYKEQWKRDTY